MTAQQAYEKALGLLDELETDGTVSDDTNDAYEHRAIHVIDMLQRDLARCEGVEPNTITALTDTLRISDMTAATVLPYGIAANFALVDSMTNLYSVYQSEYLSGKLRIKTKFEDINDDMHVMSGF